MWQSNFKHPANVLWASFRADWYGSGTSPRPSNCERGAMGWASPERVEERFFVLKIRVHYLLPLSEGAPAF